MKLARLLVSIGYHGKRHALRLTAEQKRVREILEQLGVNRDSYGKE